MTDLLNQLNDKQKEAVLQTEGPVLILAGAGSGKTRALTFRVAYLIQEKNILPRNILAVTFTNKAAGEMLMRIKQLLKLPEEISFYATKLPYVGTFHSIGAQILRKEIEVFGYNHNFVIYDDQDQLVLMKRTMKALEISPEEIKPQAILNAISKAKNQLIDEEDFEKQTGNFYEEQVARCYHYYANELKKLNALDFDDLIYLTVKLFQQYPKKLEYYQDIFRYIMVDEYQDTNHAQYILLKLLAQKRQNICVVGDDFQSVYMWRGAEVQNILNFEKDYARARVILLEQNYRSSQHILEAAHNVIEKNVNQKKKKLWTKNTAGELLTLYEASNEKDEAQFIVNEIKQLTTGEEMEKEEKKRLFFSDFAVLYRTNAQSRALEEAFLKENIPYKIVGGIKFYQRKEIKDILAYLYFLSNPKDAISFKRIVNVPGRGLGEKTVEKLLQLTHHQEGDILRTIKNLDGKPAKDKKKKTTLLQKNKIIALQSFGNMIERLREFAQNNSVTKIIEKIYKESGYEIMLNKLGEEGEIRKENIMELLTVAGKYDKQEKLDKNEELFLEINQATDIQNQSLMNFLEEVALVSQTDRDLEGKKVVHLMTMHAAKGLEYEVVFIAGMEEGLFPHSRATFNEKELEEERRLCYVAITRAKSKAYLLFTQTRNIYGTMQVSTRSRFIDEIDNKLFKEIYHQEEDDGWENNWKKSNADFLTEEVDLALKKTETFKNEIKLTKKLSATEYPSKNKTKEIKLIKFKDGTQVLHHQFGKGITVTSDADTVTVAFPKIGVKKLSKAIANLKKI